MSDHPMICVCGAGTMGSGIAQVFAQRGFTTILFDLNTSVLEAARAKISKYAAGSLSNISFTNNLRDCRADFIIEAIVEKADIKVELLNRLSELNTADTIFATNTSSLSVTSIAEQMSSPENFAGMHFFNPAPLMKLVEVVATPKTSQQTIGFMMSLVKRTGKTAVLCSDSPGFIVNRVARPYYLESLRLLEQYDTTPQVIDDILESTGFKMGPFKLMDLIGNDINYTVSCVVHESLGKPDRLAPSPLQERKVKDGLLGRKTGKGYYEYPGS